MKKYFFTIHCYLFLLAFKAKNALAYNFDDHSGVSNTAEGTGHDKIETVGEPADLIAMGIQVFLGLLGIIFLILIIYAGSIWMIARGNAEEIEKAKKTISRSIIGLIVILGAFIITSYVMSILLEE